MPVKRRLLIGISGASGAPIAIELLRQLKEMDDVETHLIITKGAALTIEQETEYTTEDVKALAHVCYENDAIGAQPASGSYRMEGMIIVPCSMKTAAGIVSGYSDNLLLRAADVMLKERRKLVLIARESPLSTIHLRNLYELSRMGAVIMPPMLTWYNHPENIGDCTRYTVSRILRQFDLDNNGYEWEGM